jgi:hypothetical protein
MHISHNFSVTLKYTYDCSERTLNKALGVGENTCIPWIKAFADIFGMPTSSYDGYIRDVTVSNDAIFIDAYIVEDGVKFTHLHEHGGENWQFILTYLIKTAIMKNAFAIKELKSVDIMNFKFTSK